MIETLNAFDQALFFLVNGGAAESHRALWLDEAMLLLSARLTWFLVAGAVLIYGAVRRRGRVLEVCLLVGVSLGLADLVTYQFLKPTFSRMRPCHQLDDVRLVQERCGGDYGFPSNHAANGMATAVVVALVLRRRLALLLVPIAVLVGLSRVYLGVHFPGDVTVGFVVGAVVATGVYLVQIPLRRRIVAALAR